MRHPDRNRRNSDDFQFVMDLEKRLKNQIRADGSPLYYSDDLLEVLKSTGLIEKGLISSQS